MLNDYIADVDSLCWDLQWLLAPFVHVFILNVSTCCGVECLQHLHQKSKHEHKKDQLRCYNMLYRKDWSSIVVDSKEAYNKWLLLVRSLKQPACLLNIFVVLCHDDVHCSCDFCYQPRYQTIPFAFVCAVLKSWAFPVWNMHAFTCTHMYHAWMSATCDELTFTLMSPHPCRWGNDAWGSHRAEPEPHSYTTSAEVHSPMSSTTPPPLPPPLNTNIYDDVPETPVSTYITTPYLTDMVTVSWQSTYS